MIFVRSAFSDAENSSVICIVSGGQGYNEPVSEAEGIAAGSKLFYLPNNMPREFFGVIKDLICGNMDIWNFYWTDIL